MQFCSFVTVVHSTEVVRQRLHTPGRHVEVFMELYGTSFIQSQTKFSLRCQHLRSVAEVRAAAHGRQSVAINDALGNLGDAEVVRDAPTKLTLPDDMDEPLFVVHPVLPTLARRPRLKRRLQEEALRFFFGLRKVEVCTVFKVTHRWKKASALPCPAGV